MQSATSFFNRALFRKNLQRFWPLWLGYVLIWLLLLPLPLLNELADYHGVPTVADASYYLLQIGAYGGLVMGAVFGIFFAMAMFAYLTNPRATQGFHSMPVRRETLYATNYLTGLVCMVSALVLAFALAGITAACFGALNLTALGTALLAAVLSVLFFYSFAVLCMMFTGQILAAPVFYGTLNFLAVGMEYLVRTFAGNFLYGYSGYSAPETFAFLSPAWELVCVLDVSNVARVDRILSDGTYQVIRGGEYMLSGLGVLGIYAAVGIVLAVLGLLVYRRRASEATGSIVTVAWARPIFKYGVAVCAAFSLGQLIYFLVFGLNLHNGQYSLPGTIACMLFTGLLGYFAAEMLLHKSFRVWRTGRVGALVFSAVLVCFGVAMSLDLTGYEGYTPDAEEVEFVSVYLSSNGDYLSCKLDEPESIERTLAAHRAMIADKANWTDFSWAHYTPKPEFGDGTVSIASTTETKWALAGYKKQKFRNTEFQFKYRQTAAENDSKTANYGVLSWSFDSSVTNLSWNKAGGVMVTFEPDKTVLYAKGDADNGAVPKSDLTLENGKTYDMTFSFCQISANQLRVVLKVDGKEWFNEVYTDAMLANSAGYFNFGTRDNTSATIEKTGKVVVPEPDPEPTYDVVDVTDMLADTANWTLGYDAPTFAEGSITAKTADGFSIGGYNTPVELGTVYRFKYKNVRASGWYDGFYLGFKAANIYWLDGGVQVDFNDDSTAIHFYNGNEMVHQKAQSPSIESGKEYEIEFGLLKAGDDTVKVHLTINGTPYFADVEVKNSVFVSTPLYFGIFARGSEATISKPDAK